MLQNQAPAISIILGTKAQLIKMFPIMQELDKRNIPYRFIDTGQHAVITETLRKDFGIRPPDTSLFQKTRNINSIFQAIGWFIRGITLSVFHKKKIFGNTAGISLIHGDTLSTLLGLVIAKMAGQKVGHIEAGERTGNLRHPFPEEIIRIIVDRYSDYAFASSDKSQQNLLNENISGEIIHIGQNTIVDAIDLAASQKNIKIDTPGEYVLVSIHRFETLKSKERMQVIIEAVLDIAEKYDVVWGLHDPTRKHLQQYGLLKKLEEHPRIHLRRLWDYFPFITAMRQSKYLITDGGGPQEESYFLGVPCMLMRSETEREQHPNVYITHFDRNKIDYFINNFESFRVVSTEQQQSPSKNIVDYLENKVVI